MAILTMALVIAVIMSATSMYCTVNKVDGIEHEILTLLAEKERNIRFLAERWDINTILNSRMDTAYLMSLVDKKSPRFEKYLRENMEKYASDKKHREVTIEILELVAKKYEKSLLEYIDNIYIENVKLQEQVDQLQKQKNYYKSLAQTLQVLALAVALIFGRVSI